MEVRDELICFWWQSWKTGFRSDISFIQSLWTDSAGFIVSGICLKFSKAFYFDPSHLTFIKFMF